MAIKKILLLLLLFPFHELAYSQNDLSIKEIDEQNRNIEELFRTDTEKALKDAKRILNFSKEKKYKKGQIWSLFIESSYYEQIYDYSTALKFIEEAIRLVEKDTVRYNKMKLYYLKGKIASELSDIETTIESFKLAIDNMKYMEGEEKYVMEYRMHTYMGRVYERVGKIDEALNSYMTSMKIAKKNKLAKGIIEGLFDLGFVQESQRNFEDAITYYEQTLEESTRLKDTTYMIYSNATLGNMYMLLEKKNKANNYYQNALQLAEEKQHERGLGMVYHSLSDYYTSENNLEKAILYTLKSREIDEKLNNIDGVIANHIQLANIYRRFEKYNLAMKEAKKGIEAAENIKADFYLNDLYWVLAKISEEQGKYKDAYTFFLKHVALNDTIFNKKSVEKINELQIKYETEKKEQQIKNLQQQKTIEDLKNKQEVSKLQAQRSILGLILLAPISLLIGGGWYVNRRRLHLQLEAEQKERAKQLSELKAIRSQMNPHFIFNALNSIQDFILLSEKENASLYLGKFATLMRGFLDSSSKSRISLDKELPLLKSYIELEGLRLGEEFSYEINFNGIDEDGLDEIEVPPLLIQPYLENAFKHGLLHKKGDKKLTLDFSKVQKQNNNFLQLKITDNGVGRQKSSEINARKAKTHQSFSTQATSERLELLKNQSLSNKNIEVEINDLKDEHGNATGTEIVILIPN